MWRRHHNVVRPHSSLDYRAPVDFRRRHEPPTREPSSISHSPYIPGAGHTQQTEIICDKQSLLSMCACFDPYHPIYHPWHYVRVLTMKPGAFGNGARH